jgi:hypothetical protein
MRCGRDRWTTDMSRPKGKKGNALIRGMQFAQWASTLPRPPTWREIQSQFGVPSNTARNWRTYWLKCLPNPYSRDIPGGNRIHADQEPTP